jgi:hypothetical protein
MIGSTQVIDADLDAAAHVLPADVLARVKAARVPWPRGKMGVHAALFPSHGAPSARRVTMGEEPASDHFTDAARRTRDYLHEP